METQLITHDPQTWNLATLAAGAFVTALLIAIGHWFPWPSGRLARIEAYTYGTTAIFIGFSIWRLLNGDPATVIGLLVACVAAGLTVCLAYKTDDVVLAIRQARKAEIADEELD